MPPALLSRATARLNAVIEPALDRWTAPASPSLAVECAPGRLIAARSDGSRIRVATDTLSPGVIVPSAMRANLADPAALSAPLARLLASIGGAGENVALLVPDLTARLAVLEFESIPVSRDEQAALARFRLRKSLPFADEQAVFSCQMLSASRLLVAFADRARLDEYENCLDAAGASAATVLPSGLACCSAHAVLDHATLLLRAEPGCLTSAFCWHGRLEFFRVLELASAPTFDDVFPSVAFFRDRLETLGATPGAPTPTNDTPTLYAAGLDPILLDELHESAPWVTVRLPEVVAEIAAGDPAPPPSDLLAVAGLLRGQFA